MTDFAFNESAMFELEHDPEGPVGRDLERRVIRGEAAAKRFLSMHGTGRIYRKSHPTRIHQASAPGEPPAPDTGLLRAAVGHAVGTDAEGLYAEFGIATGPTPAAAEREGDTTISDIGIYLELGTRHLAPRPWLRPSVPAAAGDSEL
jgi:hypothetical protein